MGIKIPPLSPSAYLYPGGEVTLPDMEVHLQPPTEEEMETMSFIAGMRALTKCGTFLYTLIFKDRHGCFEVKGLGNHSTVYYQEKHLREKWNFSQSCPELSSLLRYGAPCSTCQFL